MRGAEESKIHSLYKTLQDSEDGYKECAQNVKDDTLKHKFRELSAKRTDMLETLKRTASQMGADVESSGSVAAAAHRVFIDLKALFTRGDQEAIVKEVERGESTLMDEYEDAIKSTDAVALRELLQDQLNEVRHDLAEVKTWLH